MQENQAKFSRKGHLQHAKKTIPALNRVESTPVLAFKITYRIKKRLIYCPKP